MREIARLAALQLPPAGNRWQLGASRYQLATVGQIEMLPEQVVGQKTKTIVLD